MFFTRTFVAALAFAAPFVVRADVTPTGPAPGAVYDEGAPCPITWKGDTSSTTVWKNMAIQLMTGSNLNVLFITTVATDQDGTIDGQFTYPCPKVTPNSAIYFYQFNAPNAPNTTYTTRFAIATTAGLTTPPANATQPNGDAIPWGVGALDNPVDTVPQPSFVSGISMPSATAANSSSLGPSSTTASASSTLTNVVTSASPLTPLPTSQTASPTPQFTTITSGAMTGFDIRVLGAAAAAAATLALSFVW